MNDTKRERKATVESATVARQERVVKVGEIVLYAQRNMSHLDKLPHYTLCPMIVTTAHNKTHIDGVVFSANPLFCPQSGCKRIEDVAKGNAENQWRFLQ